MDATLIAEHFCVTGSMVGTQREKATRGREATPPENHLQEQNPEAVCKAGHAANTAGHPRFGFELRPGLSSDTQRSRVRVTPRINVSSVCTSFGRLVYSRPGTCPAACHKFLEGWNVARHRLQFRYTVRVVRCDSLATIRSLLTWREAIAGTIVLPLLNSLTSRRQFKYFGCTIRRYDVQKVFTSWL